MKRKRRTPDQIIGKLRDADRILSDGRDLAAVCQAVKVSEATFHRWRNQYGGMKADEAKRLKELEIQNRRLKKAVTWDQIAAFIGLECARLLSKESTYENHAKNRYLCSDDRVLVPTRCVSLRARKCVL